MSLEFQYFMIHLWQDCQLGGSAVGNTSKVVQGWRAVMLNEDKRIGREAVYIRDCYVWAEIYYLDSPTSYREYLPHTVESSTFPENDLVMLDDSGDCSSTGALGSRAFATGCFLIVFAVLLCVLVYSAPWL
jgi:hypothetical protein